LWLAAAAAAATAAATTTTLRMGRASIILLRTSISFLMAESLGALEHLALRVPERSTTMVTLGAVSMVGRCLETEQATG